MTVFDVFSETPYDLLSISRGEVYGSRIVSERRCMGVFKLKSGMVAAGEREAYSSNATLHIHPEDATDPDDLVGNGVRVNGVTYDITGMTEGKNFDNGRIEHYTLTLERVDYVS